jgi:predicted nucleotidyltransferase
MQEIRPLLTKITSSITKTKGIKKIILFGSRARGDADEKSDIDVAIICPNISDRDWLDICDRVENINTLLEINLIRFDSASKKLQNKILQEGITLYEQR